MKLQHDHDDYENAGYVLRGLFWLVMCIVAAFVLGLVARWLP